MCDIVGPTYNHTHFLPPPPPRPSGGRRGEGSIKRIAGPSPPRKRKRKRKRVVGRVRPVAKPTVLIERAS